MKMLLLLLYMTLSFAGFPQGKGDWNGFDEEKAKSKKSTEGFYFGIGVMHYRYGLTPLAIYSDDVNRKFTVSRAFGQSRFAPGFSLGFFSTGRIVKVRIEFSRNGLRTSSVYSDSMSREITDKIKIFNSQLKFIFYRSLKKFPRLSFGMSMDLGIFRTRQKRSGGNYSGKWMPFYYEKRISGSDVKSSSPTVGAGLFAAYRLGRITFSLSRQAMIMDAAMNGHTGPASYFNTHNNQISLYYALY